MEWNTPELKPFIDGRVDVFIHQGVFNDFVKATAIEESLDILNRYRIDYALLKPNQPLTYLLEHSPGWHLIYFDKVAVVLERSPATPAPAPIPLKAQSN
jgi:hypothetical protein